MRHLFHIPVILLVAGILWLPVFPSQDGPLHLYYADVEQAIAEDAAAYGGEFRLKPARLFYTFAGSFLKLLSPLGSANAEKLLVILCVVAFCYGLRSLAIAAGGSPGPALLLIYPFVLHTALYRGFYNYNLGIALLLWTCAFWLRHSGHLGGWRSAVFALLILLHLATHPIPLLLAALLAATGLTIRIRTGGLRRYRTQLIHVAVMFAAVVFVTLRVSSGSAAEAAARFHPFAERLTRLARLMPLLPWDSWLLWTCAILSLGTMLALAAHAWRAGEHRWRLALLLLAGLGGLAAPLIVPAGYGPLANIDERFPIVGAAFLCVAATTASIKHPRLLAAALLLALVAIGVNLQQSHPIAASTAALLDAPLHPPGIRGVIVAPPGPAATPPGARFAACQWAPARHFRRSKTVLANFAWLDQAQHRLQPNTPGPLSYRDPQAAGDLLYEGTVRSGFDLIVAVDCRTTDRDFHLTATRLGLNPAVTTPHFTSYERK